MLQSSQPRLIARLCGAKECCPEIKTDGSAPPEKRIVITDDFGDAARMSKEQFAVLVKMAKEGDFDDEI